jgi:hypothetical protein
MTVTPVQARCTRCAGDFALGELLVRNDGCCPRCGWRLTDDWAPVLLDEARRVDFLQRHLAISLRRLRDLPGNVALLPHPVLRNVADALGWEGPGPEDGDHLDDQRKLLADLAADWNPVDRRTGSWSRRARKVAA